MSAVFRREELFAATLNLGGEPIDLSDYATTGLRVVAIGGSGSGKTNCGLLIAEQLSAQGWVAILVDPESQLGPLYGDAVRDADELAERLEKRDQPIVVVSARDAEEFVPYGKAILEAADLYRKPLFVCLDEAQCFSSVRQRNGSIGEASDLVSAMAERGRKRCLDLFVTTALRCAGSLNRSIFNAKNLTLIARQEDPTSWATLAPQLRGSHIQYEDIAALGQCEFYVFSRRGVDRVKMPMAKGLAAVAPKATTAKTALPSTFTQWDRAMRRIPDDRLAALSDPVISLLGTIVGLSSQQMLAGAHALRDELETRA